MTDNMHGFHYQKDTDGIVTVTMDMAGAVNKMDSLFREAIIWVMDRLEAESELTGVILTSAKATFFAGGDINELKTAKAGDEQFWFDITQEIKHQMRRLEKLPVPVVAAINGAALGGGLELCLACNYRIAWNSPKVTLGLPEVTLGILPGGGGVVRTLHILGLEKALPLLVEGKLLKPSQALEQGWINATVDALDELLPAAKTWIKANPEASVQPWDVKKYRFPQGGLSNPKHLQILSAATPMYYAKTRGLLPAPAKILSVVHDVLAVNFDTALTIETRGAVELMLSPVAKNLMASNFEQMGKINSGASRPDNIAASKVQKVGILGAGMMGQGIAYSCAVAGVQAVLKDVSLAAAEKGKAHSEKLLNKRIAKGAMSEEKKAAILDLITPTEDYSALQDCDLIVEAVFESVDLKAQVTREAEPMLAAGGVFGSNTSSLPITLLSKASANAENFIGIHFFSPVDRMPLVEIICGEKTSPETLAKTYDFARQIGKTPIVVNDSLGFYTTRVFCTYLDEGARLLEEGHDPVFIENMGKAVGMPVGPLAVFDEISQELTRKITQTHKQIEGYTAISDATSAVRVADKLINEFGRGGRFHGGGFYEYPPEGRKYIWPELYSLYHVKEASIPEQDASERLLFRQSIEALKCLQEGVLHSVADGNIGSLLGIGAPTWTGGFIQFVNTYGLDKFIHRCNQLAASYGERFQPPAIVAEKLKAGELFE